MTEPSATGGSGDEPAGDYSYDLAHDEVQPPGTSSGAGAAAPVEVATDTADEGGDLSYDLAHDVPRPAPEGRG